MRYVIVSVTKGNAGIFNNNIRKEIFDKFGAKSSKLPAHFTIKAPFESDDISKLNNIFYRQFHCIKKDNQWLPFFIIFHLLRIPCNLQLHDHMSDTYIYLHSTQTLL